MNTALTGADHTLAVFSEAYFEPHRWTHQEWEAAFRRAKHEPRFLVPVRLDDTPAPVLLDGLVTKALHGLSAPAARHALLTAIRSPGRPAGEPVFPAAPPHSTDEAGSGGPRLPGALPAVWGEVPARNEAFTGRDGMLVRLRDGLTGSGRSVVVLADGLSLDDYLDELATSTAPLYRGAPPSYPVSLACSVLVALKKATEADPAAAELAGLCAALAPDRIPVAWFPAVRFMNVLPETRTRSSDEGGGDCCWRPLCPRRNGCASATRGSSRSRRGGTCGRIMPWNGSTG